MEAYADSDMVNGIIIDKSEYIESHLYALLTQTPNVTRSKALSILPDGVCKIKLSRGLYSLIDEQNFEWANQWKWSSFGNSYGNWYAARVQTVDGNRQIIRLHRAIFLRHNPSIIKIEGDVDHVNQSSLDNRLINLRLATRQQNSGNRPQSKTNTSGYKGVNLYTLNGSWRAQIMDHGKKRHIGYYATAEEAALAYNEEAKKVFGDFAYLNQGIKRTDFTKLNSANNLQEFRGVTFHKRIGKWQAYIGNGAKRKHLGYFNTEIEALECVAKAKRQIRI